MGRPVAEVVQPTGMNFRLDSSFDHWLLDEFRDTSRLQWQALRDLVDEIIQSDSGRRSFFYVGDTKQAIYSWRGGDPRLFDEVSDLQRFRNPPHRYGRSARCFLSLGAGNSRRGQYDILS